MLVASTLLDSGAEGGAMRKLWVLVIAFGMVAEVVAAQYVTPTPAPAAAPPAKTDRSAVEHGSRPDPGAVRPGNEAGDQPSAAAGDLVRKEQERRILGLPVNAALIVGGVIVLLLVVAGVVIPGARRRHQARGGGTY
jgi:hypothetical protein